MIEMRAKPETFSVLLFDLDGTLTDPKVGITRCVNYALAYFGREVENSDELVSFIGPPLLEQFIQYCGFTPEEGRVAVEKYRERYEGIGMFENRIYPGIAMMLKRLREEGKILAVATSKPEIFARKILEKYGILSYFQECVGSELDGRRTKKAEVIQEALCRLKIDHPQRPSVLMVGDREHDVLGAKAFGVPCLGVRFGFAAAGELEEAGASYLVDTVKELETVLLSM